MYVPTGVPPPVNMTVHVTNTYDAINVKWNPRLYLKEYIAKYTIKIPSVNYTREETGTSHVIKSERSGADKVYTVQVSSISLCGYVSEPTKIFLNYPLIGKINYFMYSTTDIQAYINLKLRS